MLQMRLRTTRMMLQMRLRTDDMEYDTSEAMQRPGIRNTQASETIRIATRVSPRNDHENVAGEPRDDQEALPDNRFHNHVTLQLHHGPDHVT